MCENYPECIHFSEQIAYIISYHINCDHLIVYVISKLIKMLNIK